MNKSKMLLTGSAGFIGANFVRKVIYDKYPYEVISIDKVANSSMLNNIYQHKLHEFYIADICDAYIMDKLFDYVRPDVVVHMAAQSSVDASIKNATDFINSNVLGTQILVNLAVKYKVNKFHLVSTDEVLGALKDKNEPVWTEEAPMQPRNPYSASKAAAEFVVRAAAATHGLSFIITRSCNNFGPRQTPDKLIPRVIKSILEGKSIPVYGRGEQIRDWIHVYDNCAAFLRILERGTLGETYNISASSEYSNLEVVKSIIEIMGEGKIEFVQDRPGHDFRYGIDASKLRQLGWAPVYKFHDGLKQTVDWYQQNRFFLNSN